MVKGTVNLSGKPFNRFVLNELDRFQVITLPRETASLPAKIDLAFLKDGPYQERKPDGGIHIDSSIGRFLPNLSPGLRLFEGAPGEATPFGIVCRDLKGILMAAFFPEQELGHWPQLLNIVLRNSSPNVNRSGRRSLLLQLGDLIVISNLIDDEPVLGSVLSSVEEGQADANGAIAECGDKDRDAVLEGGSENGPFVLELAPQISKYRLEETTLSSNSLGTFDRTWMTRLISSPPSIRTS